MLFESKTETQSQPPFAIQFLVAKVKVSYRIPEKLKAINIK